MCLHVPVSFCIYLSCVSFCNCVCTCTLNVAEAKSELVSNIRREDLWGRERAGLLLLGEKAVEGEEVMNSVK